MKKTQLVRVEFTEDEVREALGLEGKFDHVFHSTATKKFVFDMDISGGI